MNAFAVATMVDIQGDLDSVESWERVKQAFSQADMTLPGLLHFSWHVAGAYQPEMVDGTMAELVIDQAEIRAKSTGLGIFTSETPVLYFPVGKTRAIADLHERIWNALGRIANSVNDLYSPENWFPHITMAYENADIDRICQVSSSLLMKKITLNFRIDHLALIYRNGAENGIVNKIPFGRLA